LTGSQHTSLNPDDLNSTGDVQHNECRWNYKILDLEVVGSIPTSPIAVHAASPGLTRPPGAVAQWIERVNVSSIVVVVLDLIPDKVLLPRIRKPLETPTSGRDRVMSHVLFISASFCF
jgi:hypothetical protein